MRNCRHRFHKILFPAGALALLTGALLTLLLPPGPRRVISLSKRQQDLSANTDRGGSSLGRGQT